MLLYVHKTIRLIRDGGRGGGGGRQGGRGGRVGSGRVPMNGSSLRPSFLVSHRQNNNVVTEVGTPPVQSNLCTPQFALSTAVWDRVSKTQSPKDC